MPAFFGTNEDSIRVAFGSGGSKKATSSACRRDAGAHRYDMGRLRGQRLWGHENWNLLILILRLFAEVTRGRLAAASLILLHVAVCALVVISVIEACRTAATIAHEIKISNNIVLVGALATAFAPLDVILGPKDDKGTNPSLF
jgi:hypothetical protein